MADALDKAHRKGLVHRNLNPFHIVYDDGVKLVDFGLAMPSPASEQWFQNRTR
jgi:tRNA A-37 threonylcarbamoyl transferase component Bud32